MNSGWLKGQAAQRRQQQLAKAMRSRNAIALLYHGNFRRLPESLSSRDDQRFRVRSGWIGAEHHILLMRASVYVHGSLHDFIKTGSVEYESLLPGSVKDLIESRGVPHPEVGRILIDGVSAGFDALVHDGNRIDVYPCARVNLPQADDLQCRPSAPLRFILDVHLGTLARYLRLLGFDTLYRNDCSDAELAATSANKNRILLTRDVGLLKRGMVRFGHFVRSTRPEEQLREVVFRYGLADTAEPFTRCIRCNGLLRGASPAEVRDHVPSRVAAAFHEFKECPDCGRVYWQGSHRRRMKTLVEHSLSAGQ